VTYFTYKGSPNPGPPHVRCDPNSGAKADVPTLLHRAKTSHVD
jgi:hypothetical protein